MPFYTKLKVRSRDSAGSKVKKKRVAATLRKLKKAVGKHLLDSRVEEPKGETLKLATWNLREFGGSKYKGRSYEELYYIAEIISHFDIVALQEVRADMREFRELKSILGPDWDYLATDVTDGSAGNGERMVFLFNQRKAHFRNIAGELTLAENAKIRAAFGERIKLQKGLTVGTEDGVETLSGTYKARLKTVSGKKKLDADVEIPLPEGSWLELPEGSSLVATKNTPVTSPGRGKANITVPASGGGARFRLRLPNDSFDDSLRQFARTPYLVSFQVGWLKLNLCTVHIYYGSADDPSKLEQRRSEIEQISKALAGKAEGEFQYDGNAFTALLGDFNIIAKDHPTMEALESNGFEVPESLKSIPGTNVKRDKAYDQIAFWKPDQESDYTSLKLVGANVFDFFKHIYRNSDEDTYRAEEGNGLKASTKYKDWRTYKASDHLLMWVELQTDFGDDYLKFIQKEADAE